MNILQKIIHAIFGVSPIDPIDVEVILAKRTEGKNLNWRTSIVDLLKALDLDSSLAARKRLAKQLGYTGAASPGSGEWNMWLHRTVMHALAENGGKVPSDLL